MQSMSFRAFKFKKEIKITGFAENRQNRVGLKFINNINQMATVKKWKIGISGKSASTLYIYVDAVTATEALKIAKMQHPEAHGYSTPSEVK